MSDIVKAIAGATTKDLEAIDKEIENVQAQINTLMNTIGSLRSARRLIDCAVNGAPQRKPREKKAKAATSAATPAMPTKQTANELRDALEQRIYDLLDERGPLTGMQIVKICAVPQEMVKEAIGSSSRMRVKQGGVVVLAD